MLKETLDERGKVYGDFSQNSRVAQQLKTTIRNEMEASPHKGWSFLQRQALDVISDKIGRIVSGNPDYSDNWLDIAGYAMLVVESLNADKELREEVNGHDRR